MCCIFHALVRPHLPVVCGVVATGGWCIAVCAGVSCMQGMMCMHICVPSLGRLLVWGTAGCPSGVCVVHTAVVSAAGWCPQQLWVGWVGAHVCARLVSKLVSCWCCGVCWGVCKQHGMCDAMPVPVHSVAPADVGHRTTTSRPAWPFEPRAHTFSVLPALCCAGDCTISACVSSYGWFLYWRRDPILFRDRAAAASGPNTVPGPSGRNSSSSSILGLGTWPAAQNFTGCSQPIQ